MNGKYPIHDLFIDELKPIEADGLTRIPLLSFKDHLLRRFGFAESVYVHPGYRSSMKVRAVADEIWIVLHGKALLRWVDLRSDSPSYQSRHEILVDKPIQVLAPFGVAFGIQTFDEPAHLVRFSTHAEGEQEGDRVIPWEME